MAKKTKVDTFKQFVTLEQRARTSDGLGGASVEWSTLAKFWAKITPLTARQQLFSDRLEHRVTHLIETRYRSDITVSIEKRISWENRLFQVHGIIDRDERKCFLELSCEEGEAT